MAFYPSFAPGTAQGITPPLALQSTASNILFGAGTIGDTFNRVEMDADGFLRFGPGSSAPLVTLQRTAGGIFQINATLKSSAGNLDLAGIGNGLQVAEGTNAKQGTAVLVAGTVTVANTAVTASSRILLTTQTPGGTAGFLVVSARVAGTSFTILSSNAADTSTVAYEIFEPG